ncbi:hypothetical protein [Bradyrhizobium genosp. SA-3]|uniref:hypothetical protein n=1 Tax=Bradyrhizobium genosp. SA-3 TaxID=508868 RepID=UPI001029E1A7|nr:hypothetical protein [Bradyrhizobium genosp. SA-3]
MSVHAEQDVVFLAARIDPGRRPQVARHDTKGQIEALARCGNAGPRDLEAGDEVFPAPVPSTWNASVPGTP